MKVFLITTAFLISLGGQLHALGYSDPGPDTDPEPESQPEPEPQGGPDPSPAGEGNPEGGEAACGSWNPDCAGYDR